jgi:hypothetical protein
MRLIDWRATAPNRDALGPKVLATVEPVLTAMGAHPDPHCWVAWGDDPGIRFMILVPIEAGLVTCGVRVNVPGEGPRASAKLVRWNRVQYGDLALETQAGHRIISFQVEGQVLRGADVEADRVGEFARGLFAAIDGRPIPESSKPTARSRATRTGTNAVARTNTQAGAGKRARA